MNKIIQGEETEFLELVRQAVRLELQSAGAGNKSRKDELLNINQAADFLGVPVSTVYGLVSKGSIAYCKPGKRLYFLEEDLIAWVKSAKKKTNEELADHADQVITGKK